ncbi:TetR/AcrR family transcriptional regulator [Mycobacterium paraterrae]|uniref:TetR/AcrR family transcriptional regulator n=1 Tax=Mycobacterium paraterrae TaxID=577492 RepID=A0ABY3VGL4_9MYCO|nr:TetR/AcrR family transcriptional regulator [Mycobacterium paraterrae]UMB68559.1 TetR/AcrR family transcriptional regulator [Mycobacterium paraterrae]
MSDAPGKKGYHHGALRSALVQASIALAREGGPDRVILREAARAAGVSHSAAYRHFADREALLAEVSSVARNELAEEMRRRVNRSKDPRGRLRAVGTAYIHFALSEPGLFRAAFTSHPATAGGDVPTAANVGAEPFEVLGQVLDEAQAAGLLDTRRRPGAEIAVWSAVHGLANLLLDGPLPTSDAAVTFAWEQVQDLIEHGMLNDGI